MNKDLVRSSGDGAILNLRISPGARESSVEGVYGENALRLKIAAPPVDGRANSEVEEFLSGILGVRRSRVSILRGASSRDKVVLVKDAAPEEIRAALADFVR